MRSFAAVAVAVALAACSGAPPADRPDATAPPPTASETPAAALDPTSQPTEGERTAQPAVKPKGVPRPAWLGTRVLSRRPDGFGEVRPTPPVLRNRRLRTVDTLPPPTAGRFAATVGPVPRNVLQRATWSPRCPVTREQLRYLTLTFHGFDGLPHTGELLVHRSVARDIVGVFRALYRDRFPIEEMRVVRRDELDLPPTGDGNNTSAFVCRPSRGSTTWSAHAYGLAIDVNPFHNPYVKGDLVLPELASAYRNRARVRPGMILPGSTAATAFDRIGWSWGGQWDSLKDWMHFSATGR